MDFKLATIDEITNNLDSKRVPLNSSQRSEKSSKPLYPYVGANNILGYIDEFIFDEKILCVAEDGGSWGQNEKCAFIIDEKCWVNNHAHVLTAKSNLHLEYLCYYLNFKDLSLSITGATRGKLNKSSLNKIKIPLPPLATQKRIAQILDNAAALRDTTQQLLKAYDQLAQSIFLELFGDPVMNPMGWEMGFLADYTSKITDGTHHSPKMSESGYPYVTAKHIKEMYLDFDSNPTFVSQDAHNEIYNRCKPELNDVLLIKDGATTGIACLNSFEKPISLLSSVGLIKPNYEKLNPFFIAFWFNHAGVKQNLIRKYMSGAAIKRYTISKIKKFHLMIPPIELQNQFAEKIGLIEQQKALAKQELQHSQDLFNCLLQKAFKGELV